MAGLIKLSVLFRYNGATMSRVSIALASRPAVLLAIVALLTVGEKRVWAQSPQANISGIVLDKQGAVIAGAQVIATAAATQAQTVATTNESGFYSLRALPIGSYRLSVEKAGFRKVQRNGLVLTTGQNLELEFILDVGTVTETVEVSANASTIETRTSDVSQLIEAKSIEDMPIGDRRSMNLINITGGAVFVNYDAGGKPNFSLAGGRTQSQNFFIDGGTGQNMRLGIGQIDTDPPVEVVSEVKVLSNNYSAEYGGSAGGVIIATTKSGTNTLKGTLFEYLRNEKLDAANYFAPVTSSGEKIRAPLRYNVFGGTVGGPVVFPKLYNGKDHTFFFYAYEGSRRGEGVPRQMTVPTVAHRQGNFAQFANTIYDPDTTRVENGRNVRTPFAGNQIPASRIDPVAAKLMAFWPEPTLGNTLANNFAGNYVTRFIRDNHTAKVDHDLTSKDKLSFRYIYNSDNRINTTVFPGRNGAGETLNDPIRHQHFTYLSHTRIISPTVLNEVRFTYGNRINWDQSKGVGEAWATELGLRGIADGAFPAIIPAGYQQLGSTSQERRQFPIQQYQLIDNFSWVRGRHSLKFGFEYRKSMNYEINRPTTSGQFNFNPLSTGQPGIAASGNGLASLLLGLPLNFAARETQVLDRRSTYWAWFVQDDWTVSRDLTLNFGVRWETDTPIIDANQRMNGFSSTQLNPVSGTPGVVKFMGVDGWPVSPYRFDGNNFGPRFGFAYKVLGSTKTVLRGGYGIFFAHPFEAGAPTTASLGFENSLTLNSPDQGITHPLILRNGLTGFSLTPPALNDRFGAVAVGANANTAVTFYESDRATGYAQQFNLGLQRELAGGLLLEASYLANLGRKLPSSNLSLNQIPWEILSPNARSQRNRPFPQFTGVTVALPTHGISSYHGLALRFEKRFAQGFSLLGTYTFSKALNNTHEGGGQLGNDAGPYSDFYNRRLDYGPGGNDVRSRFTLSTVYELPFGKGKRWLADHPVRHLVGGWGLGVITLLQSGAPFTITTQVDTRNNFAAGALRADRLSEGSLPAEERTPQRWFNTAAFAQPAEYRNGTGGVGILRGDGKINFDLSLLRNFSLGETRKIQLRGEFFNITNHPNFGTPGIALGAPGFGIINSADPGRRVQVGLRVVW